MYIYLAVSIYVYLCTWSPESVPKSVASFSSCNTRHIAPSRSFMQRMRPSAMLAVL